MKKTLTLLLTLAMIFTLAACGSSAAPSKGEKEEIITGELDFSVIEGIRTSINVYNDRRPELYKLN